MAFEYFLYRTDLNNTLVARSNNSFAPLPPDSGEIFIDYFIPTNQPLYLYRESGGTIVFNNEETYNEYIKEISPAPTPEDSVTYDIFTEFSGNTTTEIINLENTKVNRSGDTMTGGLIVPTLFASTSISAPLITGATICIGNCLCSQGTTRFVGATTAASTLNVSGNTRLGSNLYLNTISTGGTLSDYTLTYDPITQVIRSIPQGSGGTANVYCFTDCQVTQANSTLVNATYLSATWFLPSGRYEMEYNAIFGNDTSNRCAIICFLRDNIVVGACNLAKTNDTNARTTAYVTQDWVATGDTNHTVSIVHRQCGGGNSIVNFGAIRFRKTGA